MTEADRLASLPVDGAGPLIGATNEPSQWVTGPTAIWLASDAARGTLRRMPFLSKNYTSPALARAMSSAIFGRKTVRRLFHIALIGVACLTFGMGTPAEASELDACAITPPKLSGVAIPGATDSSDSYLTLLCNTTAQAQHTLLLPNGGGRVLRALAGIIVDDPAKLANTTEVDRALRKVFPVFAEKLCTGAEQKLREPHGPLTAACLRPKCLDDPQSDPVACHDLPSDRNALRSAFIVSTDPSRCAQNPTDVNCQPSVENGAVALGTAAAILIPFVQANRAAVSHSCTKDAAENCNLALKARLIRSISSYEQQRDLIDIVERIRATSEGARVIDGIPKLASFYKNWRSDFATYTSATLSSTDDGWKTLLSSGFIEEVARYTSDYQAAVTATRKETDEARFRAAKAIRAQIDSLAGRARGVLSSTLSAEIKNWRKVPLPDEKNRSAFIAAVDKSASTLLDFEVAAGNAIQTESLSVAHGCHSTPQIDVQSGMFDVCFGGKNKAHGVLGLRFIFTPCFDASRTCSTVGHLDVLLQAPKVAGTNTTALPGPGTSAFELKSIPLGVTDIRGTITDGRLTLVRPPSPAYHVPDRNQLEQAVALLLPYPLDIKLVDLDLTDGPTLKLSLSPSFELPGLKHPQDITINIGPRASTIKDALTIDDLEDGARATVRNALSGATINANGVSIVLDSAAGQDIRACNQPKPGDLAALLSGVADFGPQFDLRAHVTVAVDCYGHLAVSFRSSDDVTATWKQLARIIQGATGGVDLANHIPTDVVLTDHRLQFTLSVSTACSQMVSLDLSNPNAQSDLARQVIGSVAKCKALEELDAARKTFPQINFAGLMIQSDGTRACTLDVSTLGRICLSSCPKKLAEASVADIRIEDDGRLVRKAREALARYAPVIGDLRLENHPGLVIVMPVRLTLPGISDPITVDVPITDKINISTAILPAVQQILESEFLHQHFAAGPVQVEVQRVSLVDNKLSIIGGIHYGPIPATLTVQLLPTFGVSADPPDVKQLLATIAMTVTNEASALPHLTLDPDGVPALHIPIDLNVPLLGGGPFNASTILNVRANGQIHLGSVDVMVPGWLPIAGGIDIGRAEIQMDLDHPDNAALGAVLAMTSGEATSNLARFQAHLAHNGAQKRVDIRGSLIMAGLELGKADGFWDYARGVLDIKTAPGGAARIIPVPQGRIVIDGPGCSLIGTASFNVLGAKLADASAGFLIGKGVCHKGANPAVPDVAAPLAICGESGQLGAICLAGKVGLGLIDDGVSGYLKTRLDGVLPTLGAKASLKLGVFGNAGVDLQARVTPARALIRAGVLGIHVSFVLPNVQGLSPDVLKGLLANLLRPSIDLQALLSGKFNVNPLSRAGSSGGGDSSGSSKSDNDSDGADSGDDIGDADANAPAPAPHTNTAPAVPPVQTAVNNSGAQSAPPQFPPSDFEGPWGDDKLFVRKSNTSNHFWVEDIAPDGTSSNRFNAWFRYDDAKDLAKGRLAVQGFMPTTMDDGRQFWIACQRWQCVANSEVALWVADTATATTDLPPRMSIALPIGDVFDTVEDGDLRFPSLTIAIAARQIAGFGQAYVLCLKKADGRCVTALLSPQPPTNGGNAVSNWSLHSSWAYKPLNEIGWDTFAGRLLAARCKPNTGCDQQFSSLIASWNGINLYAASRADPGALPTSVIGNEDGKDFLFNVASTGDIVQTYPLTLERAPGIQSVYNFDVPPIRLSKAQASPLIPLIEDIAKVIKKDDLVIINAQGPYAAATVGSGTTRVIFSAVISDGLSGEQACSRRRPWTELKTIFDQAQDATSPAYGVDLSAELARQFMADAGQANLDQTLLGHLVSPETAHEGFHRSPLLLFPRTKDIVCLSVGPN